LVDYIDPIEVPTPAAWCSNQFELILRYLSRYEDGALLQSKQSNLLPMIAHRPSQTPMYTE